MTYIGSRLKYLRKLDKITQQQLADSIGVAKSTISMYENGQREPDFETLEALADHFNVDMRTFFPGDITPGISTGPAPADEGRLDKNLIRIAGRDGTYVERRLTDDQLSLMKSILNQLKPIDDDSI